MAEEMGSEMMLESRSELRLPTGQGVGDMWGLIFDYLEDPLDYYHLLLASPPYFEPLLQDRKSSVLLYLALPILERRDYIPKTTTLNCRLVSKLVKSAIDKCLQDGNPCFENAEANQHGRFDPDHGQQHCWSAYNMQKKQLQTYYDAVRSGLFTPGRSTPFLLGVMRLSLMASDFRGDPVKLWNFRYLLSNYGNQIRHFQFFFDYDIRMSMFELLPEFLSQMPKLRSLEISNAEGQDDEYYYPVNLPNMTDLRVLKIACSFPDAQVFNVLLRRYGSQLEMLSMDCELNKHYNLVLINLCGNLKQLALHEFGCLETIRHYLNPARNWPPSLETLSIWLLPGGAVERNLDYLFVALERCFGTSRTLRNLNIVVSAVRCWRPEISLASTTRLSLPSLKNLRVSTWATFFTSIDFILGMSGTLKELILDFTPAMELSRAAEENPSEKIRFLEHLERMHDSNVWDLMPKLEHIIIRRRQSPRTIPEIPIVTYRYLRR